MPTSTTNPPTKHTFLRPAKGGFHLYVHVQPGARKSGIVGVHGERLKIQISAPPEGHQANLELLDFLSKALNVPRPSLEIKSGQTSRQKMILVLGDLAPLEAAISTLLKK